MLLSQFDAASEKQVSGWLRIVFFASILFNHTLKAPWEFLDERMWIVWAQTARDFGVMGFFLIAGTVLKGKTLETDRVLLPSNLLKLVIAAAVLAAFDMAFLLAKGGTPGPVREHFYNTLYDTNLWFFLAYAFAGPLLLSLDRRAAFWTALCCLGFVMFPVRVPVLSTQILHSISLGFVAMAIGMELHGRRWSAWPALALAAISLSARVWLDDFGSAVYPAVDALLRVVYGVACFLLFKEAAIRLSACRRPPGWTSYLFIPYIVQIPLVIVMTVIATMLFTASLRVTMQPIFVDFSWWLAFKLLIFSISLAASFGLAAVLRRYKIRA